VILSHPPMNSLHPELLDAMLRAVARAHADPRVKAIVVTGEGKNFSAGFDIPTFTKIQASGEDFEDLNAALTSALETGPKPTVAAILGAALGGGLEVAMACNARVCLESAQLGLPELSLGIIPGFGGTQRLPRLVGVQLATQMMLTSKPLKGPAAAKAGLVDHLVKGGPKELMEVANQLAVQLAAGMATRHHSLTRSDKLVPAQEAAPLLELARMQVKKTQPNLVHPLMCVDAVEEGVRNSAAAGLAKEREVFNACVHSEAGKALVHVFLSRGATKKVKGVTDAGLPTKRLDCVAVLGGGLMGSGIATALALSGCQVLLKEINAELMQAGVRRVQANVASMVKKGKLTSAQGEAVIGRVVGCVDYHQFHKADMVIEAVIENVPLKQQIFADLEKLCSPECILSTNTSTIDINVCAGKMQQPHRIVGVHFFSPAHVMPLLEIVRTPNTPPQVVNDCIGLAAKIKKVPVVVGNCTGFAVNRVFFPYTMAAIMLVDGGVDPYALDKVVSRQFGMPMGPLRLADLVGGDVSLHVGANFVQNFSNRVYQSALIPMLNEAKRLGEKTGKGFYVYDDKRKAQPDPELTVFLDKSRANAKLPEFKLSNDAMIEFIFFPVVNEGCRVLDEKITENAADLDIATVLSMGFPAYRGGLMHWADTYGPTYIAKRLEAFACMVPKHAGFFKPCDYLIRCVAAGCTLSSGGPPRAMPKL